MGNTLHGKVAIVTGASSGIGQVTAYELARRGASVFLAARRAEALATVHQEIAAQGGSAIAVPTDIADANQVASLASRAIDAYGQVDVLVNNAGMGVGGKFLSQMQPEQIAQVVQVNLLGAMLLTQAVLPGMLERRQGVIISVASVASVVAIDTLYSASKFGLRGFSFGLRRQLQGTGVTACLISPGFIQTPMTAHRTGRMPGPEIVAEAIARSALYPKRERVVPRYYAAAFWFEQHLPWLVDRVIKPGNQ
jgi:NAD(P)-dependent dehydrogenase (short-subunit alcohol dehydrogenase family)